MTRPKSEVVRLPNYTYYIKQRCKTDLDFIVENTTENRGIIKIGSPSTAYLIGKKVRVRLEIVK